MPKGSFAGSGLATNVRNAWGTRKHISKKQHFSVAKRTTSAYRSAMKTGVMPKRSSSGRLISGSANYLVSIARDNPTEARKRKQRQQRMKRTK